MQVSTERSAAWCARSSVTAAAATASLATASARRASSARPATSPVPRRRGARTAATCATVPRSTPAAATRRWAQPGFRRRCTVSPGCTVSLV